MGQARFPLGVMEECWRNFKTLNQVLLEKLESQRMDMPWRRTLTTNRELPSYGGFGSLANKAMRREKL